MNITRLKSGYRITCTDEEFDALRFLVQQGVMEGESGGNDDPDSGWNTFKAIRKCRKFSNLSDAMSIDEDRR